MHEVLIIASSLALQLTRMGETPNGVLALLSTTPITTSLTAEHSLTGKLPLPKNGEFTSQAPVQATRLFTEAIAVMLAAPITTNRAAATRMLHEVANDLLLLL